MFKKINPELIYNFFIFLIIAILLLSVVLYGVNKEKKVAEVNINQTERIEIIEENLTLLNQISKDLKAINKKLEE